MIWTAGSPKDPFGFEIHGTYALFGWEKAANLHTMAAWTLIGLWLFAIFWHFTTGEWKQYIPTSKNVAAVMNYYSVGIFTGAPHPFRATQVSKHNPLQRATYLVIKLLVNPLIWVSGLVYLYYAELTRNGLLQLPLRPIALALTSEWIALFTKRDWSKTTRVINCLGTSKRCETASLIPSTTEIVFVSPPCFSTGR